MNKPLTFVSLKDTNGRTSSLSLYGKRKAQTGELTMSVVGGLNHNADLVPNSIEDCDKLIAFLQEWRKTQI